MVFRIVLLALVSFILRAATTVFYEFNTAFAGLRIEGALSGKTLVLIIGGLFLIWKGVKELRVKLDWGLPECDQ